jgi:hypothetical protein
MPTSSVIPHVVALSSEFLGQLLLVGIGHLRKFPRTAELEPLKRLVVIRLLLAY